MLTPAPESVISFIQAQWDRSVQYGAHANNAVAVPVPHTVPSPNGRFRVLFYWDTYFTNLGLLRSERTDLARSNCDALMWWIDQLGFVPNSAFNNDQNRSQPPVLSLMVQEVHQAEPDREWLAKAVPRLEREHDFWQTQRCLPNGMARHGHHADDDYLVRFYDGLLCRRLGVEHKVSREVKLELAGQLLAEAETGQDFTPIYDHRAMHHMDLELNCLLCAMERNLATFQRELGERDQAAAWSKKADWRAEKIRAELWDDRAGLFRPKDIVWRSFSPVAHLGTFYPLWLGIATEEQAQRVRDNLPRFEREFGVAHTEEYGEMRYQWAYPNGWPPSHWVTVAGLLQYGFEEDAVRIARKYTNVVCRHFGEAGNLWEKFDVTTGEVAGGEYEADPMVGWSAGVFIAMQEVIANVGVTKDC